MIKTHSQDQNVESAASRAADIVRELLENLPVAETFDYGGHVMRLGEYNMCVDCTRPIAEAEQANKKLIEKVEELRDPALEEHLRLAAELFQREAEAAAIRAELHGGHGSEPILNTILGFIYSRAIHDRPEHNHEARER